MFGAVDVVVYGIRFLHPIWTPTVGFDLTVLQDATRRWLAGGNFYPASQLAGPYVNLSTQILYPPVSLLLFVPSLWLPAPLWWIIPLALIGAVVVHWRPAPWAWAVIAVCLAQDESILIVSRANP